MKTHNNKLRYILLAIFFIGSSYLIPLFFGNKSSFKKKIPETNTRKILLNKKKKKNIYQKFLPINSSLYSKSIYDFIINQNFNNSLPNSEKVIPNIYGNYEYSLRIKFLFPGELSFKILDKNKNFNLSIKDLNGLPVYRSNNLMNLPSTKINIKPGIYNVKINSELSIDNFLFKYKTLKNNFRIDKNKSNIKTLNINYSESDSRALKRLVSLAKKNSKDRNTQVISVMPNGRIKGTINEDNNIINAEIGLAGRTLQHFDNDFPSIDVRATGGKTFRGISSFKLYRLETKSGLKDFVFLSILKDLGFIIPRQELVNLNINGDSKGIFLLMENFNESTFTKQDRLDGNVIGLNTGKLFYDYSLGSKLELDYFYKIPDDPESLSKITFFLSEDFIKKLNEDDLAKYIAFASIYHSVHGLGIDDLRFYQDPATNKFSPIPRDLNPGLASHYDPFIRVLATHLGWLSNNPLYTVDPTRNLEHQLKIDSGSAKNIIGSYEISNGLTDLHFSVVGFLSSSKNLKLTNKYLSYFSNNFVLYEKIINRLKNVYEEVLAFEPENLFLLNQLEIIENEGINFLGKVVRNQIDNEPSTFRYEDKIIYWNLRSSSLLDESLMPSFFAPLKDNDLSEKEYNAIKKNAFLVENQIFNILKKNKYVPKSTSIKIIDNLEKPQEKIKIENKNYREFNKDANDKLNPQNITTYLGTLPIQDSKILLLFLVRNATDDVENYTLSERDSLKNYKPSINQFFTIDSFINNKSDIFQILKNHFPIGERFKLLAFELDLKENPYFLRFNLPRSFPNFKRPNNAGWFGPQQFYIPTISRDIKNQFDNNKINNAIIKKSNLEWIIPEGSKIQINNNLIIPDNISLEIGFGSHIKIKEGKSIVLNGNLSINGTKDKPVIFSSINEKPWGGIFVGSSRIKKSNVFINNAEFKNYGTFPKTKIENMKLNGGLTFYKVNTFMNNVKISKAFSEDAINLIYSQAKLSNISISESVSDAIDLDYTDADIVNLKAENNKGDGLDISGSLVRCFECTFKGNKDKGVSVGEMSNFNGEDSYFINNDMGLANKDQSKINLKNSLMKDNRIAIAEFIKKPYFGKPKSILLNNEYINNEKKYSWLGLYMY